MEFTTQQIQYNNDFNKLIDIFNNTISNKKIEQVYLQSGNSFESALEELLNMSSNLSILKKEIEGNSKQTEQIVTDKKKDNQNCVNENSNLSTNENTTKKKKKKKKKKSNSSSNKTPRYMRINSPERPKATAPYIVLSPQQLKQKKREEHQQKLELKRQQEIELKKQKDEEELANALAELTRDEGNLIVLSEVFPDIPIRVLKSILKHCGGNVDQAMEKIINMFEDGVFNNTSNLVVNNNSYTSNTTADTNALDLFAPVEEDDDLGASAAKNHSNEKQTSKYRRKISPKLKRICKSFPDAHPFFVHSLLKSFNNNVSDVEDGLKAFQFKKGT